MDVKELSDILKKEIIEFIIASSLNIDSVPDEIEREMYDKIFTVLENILLNREKTKWYYGLYNFIIESFTNCKKKISKSIYEKID